ncbi:N-acetylmuramoyl-L-alanine amidase [Paenibacillus sp. FJAT-26967]|uniref:N-acetylmuramoyl-L-alanine amidase family protein n=1 Tax=Paenibacillus sp. FJAT-26967 TaxID=1729690 RepID=UPI0008399360|nr:N-acetylmuramoyl-L-alanine amidase [Paenibacillus sp. FJAT-26967]
MKKVRIVLDAGHGGRDSGAVANGLQEKQLTLLLVHKIAGHLGDRADTRLVRATDKDLNPDKSKDLSERAAFANTLGADYYLSVHINAGGGSGFESFVYTSVKDDSITKQIQSAIHKKIAKIFKEKELPDRGMKKANLAVLRQTAMPAALLEYGFIDNSTDAALLKKEDFLDHIARATADGLAEAFGLPTAAAAADTLKDDLAKLQKAGVINSPEYWAVHARTGGTARGDYVALLIKRMAERL